jgi:hypothetical protein
LPITLNCGAQWSAKNDHSPEGEHTINARFTLYGWLGPSPRLAPPKVSTSPSTTSVDASDGPSRIGSSHLLGITEGQDMNEYVFEVKLRAVVRVRATEEHVARKVVSSVLGSPGNLEIELANQNNAAVGRPATVTDVNFLQENDPKLLKDEVARSELRSPRA